MPDDIRIRIETEADTSGIDEITDSYDHLEAETQAVSDQVADAARQQGDAYQQMQAEMDAAFDGMTTGAEDAGQEVEQLTQEAEDLSQALEEASTEMDQTDMSVEDMISSFDELVQQFERASQSSISLKGTWKSLEAEGAPEDKLKEISRRIDESQEKEYQFIAATRAMMQQLREAGVAADVLGVDLNELGARLDKAEGHIDGVSVAAKRKIDAMYGLETAVDKVGEGIKKTGDKIDDMGGKIEKGTGKITGALDKIGAGIAVLVIDKLQEATHAVADFVKESLAQFAALDTGVRQAATMSDTFGADIDGLRERTLELNTVLNRTSEETLPAMYEALSLGIAEPNVMHDIEIASRAARAGAEELQETLITGQSIVNAYGGRLYDLEEVYDILFTTVESGAVRIADINAGMSEITSVAGEANVPLEDIGAAIAVMTRQGDSFNEVAGLLSNMLTQLQIEGTALGGTFKEAAGVGFREFIAQGGTLAGALQIIEEHADATGQSLTEMLGGDSPFYRDQQAMRGALELTGKHMNEFIQETDKFRTEAAGNMDEASQIMADSVEEDTKRMAVAWDNAKTSFGEFVAGIAVPIIDDIFGDPSLEQDVKQMALGAETFAEFQEATHEGAPRIAKNINQMFREMGLSAEEFYNTIKENQGLDELADSLRMTDTLMLSLGDRMQEVSTQFRRNRPLIDAEVKVGWHAVIEEQQEDRALARELQNRIQAALDEEDFEAAIDLMVEADEIEFWGIEDSVVSHARATGALELQMAGEAQLTMTVNKVKWEGYEEAVNAAFNEEDFGRVLEEKLTGNYQLPEVQVPLDVDTSQIDSLTSTLDLTDEELGTLEYSPEVDTEAVDRLKETTGYIVEDVETIEGPHNSSLTTNYGTENQKLSDILAKLQAIITGDWTTSVNINEGGGGTGAPPGTAGGGPDGIGLASGTPGWVQVPKGHPNDSYGPVWLSEDEWLNVLPAGSNPAQAGRITGMPTQSPRPAPATSGRNITIKADMPIFANSVLDHPSTFASRAMTLLDDLARQMH